MEIFELFNYINNVNDYVEYSFYKNSSEIMAAISKNGFENVFQILSVEEVNKGVYKCKTTWDVSNKESYQKNVTIDISGEVIYITEIIDDGNNSDSVKVDIEKEYSEVLQLMKKKRLTDTEKSVFIKIVKALFEG
ncbi:MAG: hypothetical protein N3B21_15140 [Clostridia bacterium]|nr:hypothetical protein [Clostridia bacterium]